MAAETVSDTLEKCLQLLNSGTAQPELFLNVQDDLATDFTSLTKTLYDLHNAHKLNGWKGSPLTQLVVENFDEEQIWQELELQNTAVLRHFESAVSKAVTDETLTLLEEESEEEDDEQGMQDDDNEDDDDEEEEEEEVDEQEDEEGATQRKKGLEPKLSLSDDDEDSDIDFDVDELEKQSKQKKKADTKFPKSGTVSEVDDQFFKLSDMEAFLDDMDKREGKEHAGEDIDYFQDLPSDEDDDDELAFDKPALKSKKKSKSSRNVKYKDYFVDEESVQHEPDEEDESEPDHEEEEDNDEEEEDDDDDDEDMDRDDFDEGDAESQKARDALRKVTFDLPSESEGEDVEDILGGKSKNISKTDVKSAFEKRQEKMKEKISELEKAALAEKPWQLTGEVSAQTRPENSMLEEDLDFDQASRMAPAVTEETTLQLEEIIKQRIKDQAWDDVVRKEKPKEEVFEYKKRLTLDHEKSKLSLAEVYEQEYIKLNQEKTEEEENPAHVEIQKLMDSLFLKLDALSNFHFTPKPHIPEVKVVSNLPSITMEEVAPVSVSNATLLAPEEVKEKNKAGDIIGDTEKTATDKKRDRRKKKKLKRLKIQEREKTKKLKEAASDGKITKKSKAQVEETLKQLTKGGKAKLLT
ncbi:U3 small nucleolar ribonucleoprotein MPP10-like, partial [Clarias magur]